MSEEIRDYRAWHDAYDDPDSGLSWRLRTVRAEITDALADRPGPLRVLSVCAGDGRDLLGVLAGRDDAARVRATLLEIDPVLVARARRAAAEAALDVDVREVDAGWSDAYAGAVPADLVLLVGIFGNVDDADLRRTIAAAPQLCAPGARLLWSRGRDIDAAGDRNDEIRKLFAAAGFTQRGYHAMDAADGSHPALGVAQYTGAASDLVPGQLWFRFRR